MMTSLDGMVQRGHDDRRVRMDAPMVVALERII
jgi:hypothetical protein